MKPGVGDQQSLEVLLVIRIIIEFARRGERGAERLKERMLKEVAHSDDTSNVIPGFFLGIAISEARLVAVGVRRVVLFGSPAGHARHP